MSKMNAAISFYYACVLISLALMASCSSIKKTRCVNNETQKAIPPEFSTRSDYKESFSGKETPDAFRWLEDSSNDKVKEWVSKRHIYARKFLSALKDRKEILKLIKSLDNQDAILPPFKRGDRSFQRSWKAEDSKPVYFWFDKAGNKRVLLDVRKMERYENPMVDPFLPSNDGRYLLYGVRENNVDRTTIEIMDVDTGRLRTEETIRNIEYPTIAWTKDNKGFFYKWNPWAPNSDYAQRAQRAEVRYHELGTPPSKDVTVLSAIGDETKAINLSMSDDGSQLVILVQKGQNGSVIYTKQITPVVEKVSIFIDGKDSNYRVLAHKGFFYILTNEGAPNYRVFRTKIESRSKDNWTEIVPEDKTATLKQIAIFGNRLITHYKQDVISKLQIKELNGSLIYDIVLPTKGDVFRLRGHAEELEFQFVLQSLNTPPTFMICSVTNGEVREYGRFGSKVDTDSIIVNQVFYRSKDGTKVPMFLMHSKDIEKLKPAPALLYGYGAFGYTNEPMFIPGFYTWAKKGGIVAIPGVRGGGEYGTKWHLAGMLDKKQNSIDDFLYAARWLIEKGYTNSEKIVASGDSAGGLLVGAAVVQNPGLFRAISLGNPILDMLRYTKVGDAMTGTVREFGNPDNPEHFSFLKKISPYQNIKPNTDYPAMIIVSAEYDTRVSPMHARKFTAAIEAAQKNKDTPVLLLSWKNAGHLGSGIPDSHNEREADIISFLWSAAVGSL